MSIINACACYSTDGCIQTRTITSGRKQTNSQFLFGFVIVLNFLLPVQFEFLFLLPEYITYLKKRHSIAPLYKGILLVGCKPIL